MDLTNFKRDHYNRIHHDLKFSRANEPEWNNLIDDKYKHYPDMKDVYDKFSKFFNINRDNFILTTGCEESLRIAIKIIKYLGYQSKNRPTISRVFLENPTWSLAEVVFYQELFDKTIDIEKVDFDYYYKDDIYSLNPNGYHGYIKIDDHHINKFNRDQRNMYKCDIHNIVYSTDTFNNFTYHFNPDIHTKDCFHIIDEVYTNEKLYRSNFLDDKTFYIGSLSKSFGPGFRLGYLVFREEYSDIANLFRPQYLSTSAIDLINLLDTDEGKFIFQNYREMLNACKSYNYDIRHFNYNKKDKNDSDKMLFTIHPNYISFEESLYEQLKYGIHLPTPNKKIKLMTVGEEEYSKDINILRFGVPKDPGEYYKYMNTFLRCFDIKG